MKKFLYLPSGYKNRTNTIITGKASTGEISPKGLVAQTEDWEGRMKANVAHGGIHAKIDKDGKVRNMSMAEMVERGYFFIGKGPSGLRLKIK